MAKKSFNKTKLWSLLLFVVIVGVYFFFTERHDGTQPVALDGTISVHFIDVGQGDAALIQTEKGNILIDAGTASSKEDLLGYLDALSVNKIAYAIFTHPHADHIGGAEAVLHEYTVEHVILPDIIHTSATFEKMITAIEEERCGVTEGVAGHSFTMGEVTVDLLAPVYADNDLNNMSVVAKITYGNVSFLFTGDAEDASEAAMLSESFYALDADIIKVGHHGSSSSSTAKFLNAVSPELAIISCGKDNDYGHPHREVVSRLESMNVPYYRTDEEGSIVITTDGNTYTIKK